MSALAREPRASRVATLALTMAAVVGFASAHTAAAATSGGWSNLGTSGVPGSAPLNAPVFSMTRVGTNLYIGGSFTDAGGIGAADRLARWDGNAWHAVGAGLNGEIRSIVLDGTKVYVAGAFQDASGNTD